MSGNQSQSETDDVQRVLSAVSAYDRTLWFVNRFSGELLLEEFQFDFSAAFEAEQSRLSELRDFFSAPHANRKRILVLLETEGLVGPSLRLKLRLAANGLSAGRSRGPGNRNLSLSQMLGVRFNPFRYLFVVDHLQVVRDALQTPEAEYIVRSAPFHRSLRKWIDRLDPLLDSILDTVPFGRPIKEMKDLLPKLQKR